MNSKIARILSQGYGFDSTRYMREGWETYKENFFPFFSFAIVATVITVALGLIPVAGSLASSIVSPCLMAGYFLVANKVMGRESYNFGNFFDGFQHIGQLFLKTILTGIIIVAIILGFAFVGGILFFMLKSADGDGFNPALIGVAILFLLVLLAIIIYLSVSYVFANQFIIFEKQEAWQAMEASRKIVGKNFGQIIGFFILMGLIIMLPILVIFGLGFSTITAFFADFQNMIQEGQMSDPLWIYKSLGLLLVPILLISALTTPWIFCATQAAFRDIIATGEEATSENVNNMDISEHLLGE